MNIENIVDAYIETLLWSSTVTCDYSGESVPADSLWHIGQIDPASHADTKDEVSAFVEEASDLLDKAGLSEGQIGHNIALTRNGHGAGFWDLGLGETGKALTDIANAMGTAHVVPDMEGFCIS